MDYFKWLIHQYEEYLVYTISISALFMSTIYILLTTLSLLLSCQFLNIDQTIAIVVPILTISAGLIGFILKFAYDEFKLKEDIRESIRIEIQMNTKKLLSRAVEQTYSSNIFQKLLSNIKFVKDKELFEIMSVFYTSLDYQNNLIGANKDYGLLQEKSLESLINLFKFDEVTINKDIFSEVAVILEIYQNFLADTRNYPSQDYIDQTHEIHNHIIRLLNQDGETDQKYFFPHPTTEDEDKNFIDNLNRWKSDVFSKLKEIIETNKIDDLERNIDELIEKLMH